MRGKWRILEIFEIYENHLTNPTDLILGIQIENERQSQGQLPGEDETNGRSDYGMSKQSNL